MSWREAAAWWLAIFAWRILAWNFLEEKFGKA